MGQKADQKAWNVLVIHVGDSRSYAMRRVSASSTSTVTINKDKADEKPSDFSPPPTFHCCPITTDHHPHLPEEAKRIRNAGFVITNRGKSIRKHEDGMARLNISRSFGYKPAVFLESSLHIWLYSVTAFTKTTSCSRQANRRW